MLRKIFILGCMLPLAAQALKIDGGAAPMNNIFKKIKPVYEKVAGVVLELNESGPDGSFFALQKGQVELAAAGLSRESWFELMKQKGVNNIDEKSFYTEIIGFDTINILMNAEIPVMALSKAQLKAIFTGVIRNWKEVGGTDLPIIVVLGKNLAGTNKTFQEQILDKANYFEGVKWVGTTPEIQATIASTSGSVGIGPVASLTDSRLISPTTPEVGRPITVMTKGKPSPAMRKLLDYIKGEGKAFISK